MLMQIKDMPAGERPQEKLLYYGADALSSSELLALVIRSGRKNQSALELASEVLSYVTRELGGLDKACVSELAKVPGIGTSKACSIVAAVELSRRMRSNSLNEVRPRIIDVGDAVSLLESEFENEKKERVVELLLNTKKEVEAKVTVSIGELYSAAAGPREVFSPAIRRSAAGIIIAHNHPSGDATPSEDDIQLTRRLMQAASIVGIELLDHIIIGRNSYTSFLKEGLL